MPLRFFTAAEARVVQAASETDLPERRQRPGATEAGVVIYIDRQLAGPYGRDKYRLHEAAFVESVPSTATRASRLRARSIARASGAGEFRRSAAGGAGPEAARHPELELLPAAAPAHPGRHVQRSVHGGNAGLIGWQLIGYPGPLMSYRDEIDKASRRRLGGANRSSLAQVTGRPVTGWEDEKD